MTSLRRHGSDAGPLLTNDWRCVTWSGIARAQPMAYSIVGSDDDDTWLITWHWWPVTVVLTVTVAATQPRPVVTVLAGGRVVDEHSGGWCWSPYQSFFQYRADPWHPGDLVEIFTHCWWWSVVVVDNCSDVVIQSTFPPMLMMLIVICDPLLLVFSIQYLLLW